MYYAIITWANYYARPVRSSQLVLSSRSRPSSGHQYIDPMTIYKSAQKPIFTVFDGCTSSKLGGVQCKVHIHDFQKIQIPKKLKLKFIYISMP
jgi:hypothetical protein